MSDSSSPKPLSLSGKQKQYLKGLAHNLVATVQIGKEGLSDKVIEAIGHELYHRELIKIKIGSNSNLDKHETAKAAALGSDSAMVQLIGKTIVLYRPNPKRDKEKRIKLP